jgi:hypothetical protein
MRWRQKRQEAVTQQSISMEMLRHHHPDWEWRAVRGARPTWDYLGIKKSRVVVAYEVADRGAWVRDLDSKWLMKYDEWNTTQQRKKS